MSETTLESRPPRDRARSLGCQLRGFRADSRGVAAVEFALTVPPMLMLLAAIVFGAEGYAIQGKVTQTMLTLTDLTTQQANIGTSSTAYVYSDILAAASLEMAPYDPASVAIVLSEVTTTGAGTATVVWSVANSNGSPLPVGSSVNVPAEDASGPIIGNLIVGTVSYTYNPLNIFFTVGGINLSNTITMAPRQTTGAVACCN